MNDTDTTADQAVRRAARADLCAGGAFVALGLAFAIGALGYERGTALAMGPGYIPLVLGALLAALGVAVLTGGVLAVTGARTPAEADPDLASEPPGPVPWLRGAMLLAAILLFGLTVEGLGLLVSLFVTVFLAALAGHRNTPVKALLVAAGMTLLSWVVFVLLLQLRLPLVGEWLGG